MRRSGQRLGVLLALLVGVSLTWPLAASARPAHLGPMWVIESTIGASSAINDAAFTDELNGWAVGDGGAVYLTHDGGQTWSRYTTGTQDNLSGVHFFDAHNGLIIGGSTILRTSDGGATWHTISAAAPDGISDAALPDGKTLFVIAQPSSGTNGIYASTDGGATWPLIDAQGGLDRVVFTSPTTGWATGSAGLFSTTDGGTTWAQINLDVSELGAVAFPTPALGLVASTFTPAVIERTTDGGTTWSTVALPDSGYLTALSFGSAQQGLAAVSGGIDATSDGGATWQVQTLPYFGDTGPNVAAVGYRGSLPFAVTSGGAFLHFGALPVAPSSQATAASTPAPVATATPAETSTPVPAPLVLRALSTRSVVAASGARLTLFGSGFDSLATVSLGDTDVTDVAYSVAGSLTFTVPNDLKPGTYDVSVTEPDNRSAQLSHALTVLPRLNVTARLLKATVKPGSSAVILVQTQADAQLGVQVTTATGHAVPHVTVTLQKGTRGQWRVLLAVGAHVAPATERVTVTVHSGPQQARAALSVQIIAANHR